MIDLLFLVVTFFSPFYTAFFTFQALRGVYEDDKLQKKLLNKVGPIKIDALGMNSIEMTTNPMVDASAVLRNRGVSNDVNVGQGLRDNGGGGVDSQATLRLTKEISRLKDDFQKERAKDWEEFSKKLEETSKENEELQETINHLKSL